MTECLFCDSEVEAHDPVYAEHDDDHYPFCNWACLKQYIDREDLATGACCEWTPA
ncbi:hypothetical protein [Halosegnis sp.]|uniref:hypothetical protein n=1 Tax=Halosegnis sp. TaxID=2864959 RepID=UPI0035D4B05C